MNWKPTANSPMKSLLLGTAALFAGALLTSAIGAESKGYDAYRLVRTRNIFDPNRRAPRIESAPTRRESTPTNRPHYLKLTGTMVTETKTLAFFSGSKSEYSRVLSLGDSIADGKVTAITAQQVELQREGKPVILVVGGAPLSLDGTPIDPSALEAEQHPPDTSRTSATPPSPSPDGAAPAAPTAPAASTDKNEVLRRMLERRQQEMSK